MRNAIEGALCILFAYRPPREPETAPARPGCVDAEVVAGAAAVMIAAVVVAESPVGGAIGAHRGHEVGGDGCGRLAAVDAAIYSNTAPAAASPSLASLPEPPL